MLAFQVRDKEVAGCKGGGRGVQGMLYDVLLNYDIKVMGCSSSPLIIVMTASFCERGFLGEEA